MAFLKQIQRRRIPQFMGIYLGASWAVIQFVDWATEQYLLSRHLTDLALITLVSLMPAVLLLAYYHGAPGRQALGRVGKIGVPLNVMVTVGLIAMFLQTHDLQAEAKNITVTDEDGQQITRLVPTESARRKVALFFWDSDAGDDDAWLRYGLPLVVARDLQQNPFVDVWTPVRSQGIKAKLVRAGFDDNLGVPVGLQRKIADEWNLGYFVNGRFARVADGLSATVTIYRTDTGEPLAEHVVTAPNATSVADQLTPLLRAELDVPAGDRVAKDLPVAEILTDDEEALRVYVQGRIRQKLQNDLPGALPDLQAAVERDPTFAHAQAVLGETLMNVGRAEDASKAFDQAVRHDYKLTEADQFRAKGVRYLLANQVDKRDAIIEMWVELNPTDVRALSTLAGVYEWSGNRVSDAKRIYQRIYDLYPQEGWALLRVARLAQLEGNDDEALEVYERYLAFDPDADGVWLEIGQIHRGAAKLDDARAAFEKAALLASDSINSTLLLADLDMRIGAYEEAESRLDEAERMAADDGQRAFVMRARLGYDRVRGRFEHAYLRLTPLAELEKSFRAPVDVIIAVHLNQVDVYHGTGRGDEYEALIDAAIAQYGAPFDSFFMMGHMLLAVAREQPEIASQHRQPVEEMLATWKREDLRFLTEMSRGHELRLQGNYDNAIAAFEQATAAYGRSVQSGGEDSLLVEITRLKAVTYREAGRLDDAQQAIESVLPQMPALPTLHLELAKIADARGNAADARTHAEHALASWDDADPGYQPAAEARVLAGR